MHVHLQAVHGVGYPAPPVAFTVSPHAPTIAYHCYWAGEATRLHLRIRAPKLPTPPVAQLLQCGGGRMDKPFITNLPNTG